MWTNIRYILLTAVRDWLFIGLFLGVVAAAAISASLGGTALLEPEQMILTFSAASARVILMVGLIVFICFHIRHAFDSKEIDVLLSRPISRSNLVLSYWIGFAAVATLLIIPTLGVIYWIGILNTKGFLAWSASLLLESWMVVSIALFAGLTLRSAVFSVIGSLAIYTLSRMIGFFVATTDSGMLFENTMVNMVVRNSMDFISIIVPRMDFFAKSQWLIYGLKGMEDVLLFAQQAGIFIPLLLAASIIDFRRKQF